MPEQNAERKPLLADDCPCTQAECTIRGNCVECVRHHRQHRQHLPECMSDIVRELVADLAKKVEFKVSEGRPTPEFWAARAEQESRKKKT